ncbi:MAG: alpha/beta hydrolase-fold protein [Bacteroidota bacterium]
MKRALLLLIACLLLGAETFAQDQYNIEHTIQSKAFDKERTIKVLLPNRYFRDTTGTFLVTYVLDAQYDAFWEMAKQNINYMVDCYMVIPMIVVGIPSDDRGDEFRPPATKLQQHLKEEVFPLIEANYRVKDFRTIVGHSWGGAFVTSTLFSAQADMFDAYIAIGPSIGFRKNWIMQQADSILQTQPQLGKFLYCSNGTVGRREKQFRKQVEILDSIITTHANPTLAWATELIEGTDHWSCVIPSFNDGLCKMSRNYFTDQTVLEGFADNPQQGLREQIKTFYQQQEQHFGFTFEPSVRYIRFVGDDFRDTENYSAAVDIYQWGLEKAPDNIRLHINLADTYDKMEDQALAKAALTKVQNMLEVQKEALEESFYADFVEWTKERLAKYQ